MSDYSDAESVDEPDPNEPALDPGLQREAELAMSDDEKHGKTTRLNPSENRDGENSMDHDPETEEDTASGGPA